MNAKNMTPKQRIQDLITLIKNERKYQAIAVVTVLFLAWGIFGTAAPKRGTRPAQQANVNIQAGTGALATNEAVQDLLNRFDSDLTYIKQKSKENSEQLADQQANLTQFQERSAEIFKRLMGRISEAESAMQNVSTQQSSPSVAAVAGEDLGDIQEDTIASWGDTAAEEVAPPAPVAPPKMAVIGVGDSVRVKLLSGVDAPTDGTPYPVVFRLLSDVDGPDGSALSLGEARMVAAAQGSLSNNRALFRLNNLNIRYPDGSKNVVNIDGWIVGEDGIRGMEGVLIDPIGKALAGSFMSGMVQGLGEGVEAGNTLNFQSATGESYSYVNGDVVEYAIGSGLGKADERWGRFIDQRAALLVPHVRVFSGREATAVFTKNVTLDGLYDQLENEEFQLVSLD